MKRYVINGTAYDRLDDVPEEYRDLLRDTVDATAGDSRGAKSGKRRTWQGRMEDMPPYLRAEWERLSPDGAPPAEGRYVVIDTSEKEIPAPRSPDVRADAPGIRILPPLELRGWEPVDHSRDNLEMRPGPDAIRRIVTSAGSLFFLSLVLLFLDHWRLSGLRLALHSTLWGLGLLWLFSPIWMRLRFRRDDLHHTVWIRGKRLLFPLRLKFPLGNETTLSLEGHFRGHPQTRSSPEGWYWHMLIHADGHRPFLAAVGFTPGRESPRRLPGDVMARCRDFARIFDTTVTVHIPGQGPVAVTPPP